MLTELSPRSRRFRLRRATTGAALAVFVLGAAGLLVAALAVADPPTTFTNSTAITIRTDTPAPPTPATLYPSTIAVSGMTGPVSDVDVRLNGFSHAVANDVDLLLVGPSGASLVLLSDAGGQNSLVIANNATVTFDDSASASVPQSGTISGTVSYRPTDTDAGEPAADSFPAPAPTPGSATTLAAFTGTNPNGTWSLYVVDDATGDAGAIAGGWSVTITTSEVAASTTTVVGSSPNPSTTGTSVTFTATVTSGADPVTSGTVTFTEGPTTLAANVPVNASGVATFSTAALAEGSHVITGTFNGTPTRLTSSGSVTQVVDNATTTPDGDTWCNSGGITVPSAGAGTPYPSRVTVSGAGSAISALTVDLADVAHTTPFDLEVLLVGPAGQNLVLMSDVGGSTAATGVDLTFADSAGGPIPAAGPLATGTFDPSDDDSDVADAPLPPPAPAASGATTLATFNGTNPNGTWRLFVADDASGDSGSIAGGWCLNVSTAQPSATTVTSSVNPSTVGQPVTFTATVTSGGNPVTTGSVDFTEGATTLAAGVALNASGQATFTTSTLTEGSHTITATYTGNAAFQTSSGSVTQVVQSPPGKVIVTKVNVGGDQSDAFPFTTQNLGGGSFDLAATSATGQVFDPVTPNAPGGSPTYSVTEGTGAPADKYTLTAIDCDDTDSTESLGTRTATINVSPRETVTCTFTNTRKTGQLTVVKQLVPDDDPGMFDLRIEDEVVVEDAGDGDSGSRVLPTGDYDISELAGAGTSVANYDSKVECDNGQSAVPGTSLANVQVTEDSDITCTFTNTRRTGRLTVVKQLVPEEDPGLFDLRIDDEVVGADASDGDSGSRDLPPGDYTVSELGANGTVLADYSSSISCDNGDSGPGTSLAGVTIESNDDITCTITNTRLATVRITKEVEWAGEPTGAEFDFSPNDALSDNSDPAAADFPLADGATETIVRVQPNDGAEDPSYTVSEMDRAGFRIGGVTCDDDDSEGNTATGVADIVVSAGETVTCTFVNEQINAAILVVKEGPATVFHGDQITYTFTVTNAGSSPISDVTVADDRCAPVVLEQKNNSDGDELLENVGTPDATSSESWVYTCATTVPAAHSDDEEDPIHNTVTASGEDEEGNPVSDSDTHDTDVLHPTIHVDKKLRRGSDPFVDGPIQAHVGDEIDYQFTVTSPPPSDVGLQVEFSDPRCDSGTLTGPVKSGGDDDDLLEPGESWTYQCSHVSTANDPDPLPNTAKVTGQVPNTQNPKGTVTDEDSAAVDIFHPAIDIEKTGPATAKVGDALNYTLAVTNTGDSPFAAQEVVVTDPKCQAPPAGPNTAGDATPNQLDRGDKWTYTCNAQTAGQPAGTFVNTAMVTGKDFLAKTVTDTDDFPTVLTPPPAQPGCPLAGTVIVGTDGDDERAGGPLSDVIFGALGDDLLRGLAGADCLYGQGGADRLEGARGRDRLFGGNGQDRLRGGRGRDRLRGHGDDDRLFGGRGRDRIDPGSGSDRVAAGRGNDRVIAAGTVRDRIDCGRGRRDVAIVDALDTTRNCEKVRLRER